MGRALRRRSPYVECIARNPHPAGRRGAAHRPGSRGRVSARETRPLRRLLEGFHSASILVLGDVMLDRFAYGSVARISPEAPIPVLNLQRLVDMPGGAGNVARNVAAMGARVTLCGVVGEDPEGADLRAQLSATSGIDAHLIVDSSRPTTTKTRYVADGQQIMRADREIAAPLEARAEERLLGAYSAALGRVDVVIVSDYAKGVLSESVTRTAIERARAAGRHIIVDPKSRDFSRYRAAHIITPNQAELAAAAGSECATREQVVEGARRLLAQGLCDALVVTRGGEGMSVVEANGHVEHLPTTALQVYDVSGAGDTVVAALSLSMAAGSGVIEGAKLANVAAGIVVGKRGTATVTPAEMLRVLEPLDEHDDPQRIFSLDTALPLVRAWRDQGLKIAFTNGCFDLLHPGHISLLDFARRSADRLIVGLNSDASIRRLKGPERPVQGEVARAMVLAAVKSVDAVVLFSEDTPLRLVEAIEPDLLVKGADYTVDAVVGADIVKRRGGRVLLAPLLEGHSTSNTLSRVARPLGG